MLMNQNLIYENHLLKLRNHSVVKRFIRRVGGGVLIVPELYSQGFASLSLEVPAHYYIGCSAFK